MESGRYKAYTFGLVLNHKNNVTIAGGKRQVSSLANKCETH